VDREGLRALQYIAHLQDLQSILELDLWCRSRVTGSDLAPNEVADAAVVSRRQPKTVGLTNRRLTDYVPLYFNARNAMLWSRKEVWAQLVVLDIAPNVVDLPGTRVTLRNAAAGSKSEDYPVAEGLARIQEGAVYRDGWWDANPEVMRSMKQALQAEVLVPRRVPCQPHHARPRSKRRVSRRGLPQRGQPSCHRRRTAVFW